MICTIGTNDDTEIQIYDSTSGDLQFKQATGAIQNFQILMGPNDTDLLVSTFMNDISVISFEKIDKFNNETKRYENYYKFKRNSSISGAKAKLLYYCLSNDENFFAISGDDKSHVDLVWKKIEKIEVINGLTTKLVFHFKYNQKKVKLYSYQRTFKLIKALKHFGNGIDVIEHRKIFKLLYVPFW